MWSASNLKCKTVIFISKFCDGYVVDRCPTLTVGPANRLVDNLTYWSALTVMLSDFQEFKNKVNATLYNSTCWCFKNEGKKFFFFIHTQNVWKLNTNCDNLSGDFCIIVVNDQFKQQLYKAYCRKKEVSQIVYIFSSGNLVKFLIK